MRHFKKVILFSLLLLFFNSCSIFMSRKNSEIDFSISTPDRTEGCKRFRGEQRQQCVNKLIERLENFENASVIDSIVSKERTSAFYVRYERKNCVVHEGRELKCWQYTRDVYDTALWVEILERVGFFIIGAATGISLGGMN